MMPAIVARQDSVRALLNAGPHASPALVQGVNTYLEAVNQEAGSVAVDVIDLQGSVIAASNWNQPLSFVGTNVSYRLTSRMHSRAATGASSASAPIPAFRGFTSRAPCGTAARRSARPR